MLVLGRRPGEKIRINDDIIITVIEYTGGNLRIGIDAPKDIPVHREEIYLRLKDEEEKKKIK
jgi:carbon storage regulator